MITGNDAGLRPEDGAGDIPSSGGGVYAYLLSADTSAKLTIAGSEISSNDAGLHGGGLTVCGNRDLPSANLLSVFNSTISGNDAGVGGFGRGSEGGGVHLAIFPGAESEALDARFQNVTITENTADIGGGIWTFRPGFAGNPPNEPPSRMDVRLTNSIVSGNTLLDGETPSNLYGSFNIAETVFNIIGTDNEPGNPSGSVKTFSHLVPQGFESPLRNDAGGGNIFIDDPMLGDLAENGGLTSTHRPLAGSPA